MPEERVQRKLTTILVADVDGYSHLMHVDEEATLETLEEYRGSIAQLVAEHKGRIFNTGGDSVLAEFGSTVEALRCAVAIQQDTSDRNAARHDERALRFRIGINIGDVMIRDGDLFGDGVNVAARLEGLANPGGICISGSVFDQVKNKVTYQFENMGQQTVKNIAEPVQTFRVVSEGLPSVAAKRIVQKAGRKLTVFTMVFVILVFVGFFIWQMQRPTMEIASVERMALPLPIGPSIAVLPFTNLGVGSKQELVGDGIARDIITDLSAFADLMVIASTSSFSYKGKPIKIHQVAEELGVQFVLDGSIQTSGENVRTNIQLVDVVSGEQLWAERYDHEAGDIFAIQDEITQNVVAVLGAMEGPIALADRERARSKDNINLTAYEYVLLAREARNQWTKEGNDKSLELVKMAIELDPSYARAYVEQAFTYFQDVTRYHSATPKQTAQNAIESALKAIDLDETFAEGHWVAGDIYAWLLYQPEKALASYENALALNPNHADILASYGGWILPRVLNRPQDGIEVMKKAMRLSPYHEDWYNWGLMNAYFSARQFEDTVQAFQRIKHPSTGHHLRLAASYAYLGREDEAHQKAQEILAKKPDFSTEEYVNRTRVYQPYSDLVRDGLLLAGLPE